MGPVSLVLDRHITHERWGSTTNPSLNGQLYYPRPTDIDTPLNQTDSDKIRDYRTDYNNRPFDTISWMTMELSEESDQFRLLHTSCLTNLMGSVGLILTKTSVMRISIPLDLSSRSFVPLSRFIRSRLPTPLLAPFLVLFPPRSNDTCVVFILAFHCLFLLIIVLG